MNGVEDLELILADRPAEKGGTDQESEDNKENMYLDGMSLGDANDFNCVLVEVCKIVMRKWIFVSLNVD